MPLGSQATDQSVYTPGVSSECAQAADRGVYTPQVSGVGSQAADLGAHQQGFRCVLGQLIQCSQSRDEGVGAQEAKAAGKPSLSSR